MPVTITVRESLRIGRPPEQVWDYTQDYTRRSLWDRSVLAATVLEDRPLPVVEVRGRGGFRAVLRYKQFDRPLRTSVAMEPLGSPLLVGGGGAWTYEPEDAGAATHWTQVNTLQLADGVAARLLAPLLRWQFRRSTRSAMRAAKARLEDSGGSRND